MAARCRANRDALETLPGVGRKTANVVLNVAFGEPTIAVDTHIFRVANRTGLAPGKTPLAVELKLEKVDARAVPSRHAHHWLILHGRYICKARTPECWRCPVVDLCAYKPKTPAPKLSPAPLQPVAEPGQQLILRQARGLGGGGQVVVERHPIAFAQDPARRSRRARSGPSTRGRSAAAPCRRNWPTPCPRSSADSRRHNRC